MSFIVSLSVRPFVRRCYTMVFALLALVALVGAVSPIWAQAPVSAGNAPRTFTLEECLKIAANDNFDVQDAMARLTNAESSLKAAFGQYLPTANLNAGYGRQLNTTSVFIQGGARFEQPVENPNFYSASASINYTVFNGFTREAGHTQAQFNRDAADMNYKQARRRILSLVRSQYINILRAKQIVQTRREDFEVGKKQLERVRAQYEAGVVAIAPVYTQEADVSNRELAIVQAENDFEVAKGTLLATLGLNPTMNTNFADIQIPQNISADDIGKFRTTIGSADVALSAALQKRVDYAAANASLEAANAGVKAANGAWLPTISAGLRYQWNGNSIGDFNVGSSQNIGLNLSYNLFDGFQRDNQYQQAQVQVMQGEIQKRQTEQRISSDVQNALVQLSATEKNLDITSRSLKSAEQNFSAAEERFKVGAANILDYTTANGTLINARINRINAMYNYISAQYQAKFALGTLDE